jgi:hypothetical protein
MKVRTDYVSRFSNYTLVILLKPKLLSMYYVQLVSKIIKNNSITIIFNCKSIIFA